MSDTTDTGHGARQLPRRVPRARYPNRDNRIYPQRPEPDRARTRGPELRAVVQFMCCTRTCGAAAPSMCRALAPPHGRAGHGDAERGRFDERHRESCASDRHRTSRKSADPPLAGPALAARHGERTARRLSRTSTCSRTRCTGTSWSLARRPSASAPRRTLSSCRGTLGT
jgi:hypothetical protein